MYFGRINMNVKTYYKYLLESWIKFYIKNTYWIPKFIHKTLFVINMDSTTKIFFGMRKEGKKILHIILKWFLYIAKVICQNF